MTIPFTKAHGAKNDFLLTWASDAPPSNLDQAAIAICDRYTGLGADGWLLVEKEAPLRPASIRLFNSDGGEVEISGNGTRCAAALLIQAGHPAPDVPIQTGAGLKHLRLCHRDGQKFVFEMNMGRPVIRELKRTLQLAGASQTIEAVILDVGNPQCAVIVESLDFDWRSLGAEIERHTAFPRRTNVSFVQILDEHTIAARFYERGAGATMSSGTGSTGAAAAAIALGLAQSPVTVRTEAGDLPIEWKEGDANLTGPAELVATGEYWWNKQPDPR